MQDNSAQLLVAIVPQELKDSLVDCLIEFTDISGFSLNKIQGYSREHHQYNIQEQVEGYRDFFRFEVLHQSKDFEGLLNSLKNIGAGNVIRYWCIPVYHSGVA